MSTIKTIIFLVGSLVLALIGGVILVLINLDFFCEHCSTLQVKYALEQIVDDMEKEDYDSALKNLHTLQAQWEFDYSRDRIFNRQEKPREVKLNGGVLNEQ